MKNGQPLNPAGSKRRSPERTTRCAQVHTWSGRRILTHAPWYCIRVGSERKLEVKQMKHENVKKMAALALLAALVVVLQTVASGIKVGPIPDHADAGANRDRRGALWAGRGRRTRRDLRAGHGDRRSDRRGWRDTGADPGERILDAGDLHRQGDGRRLGGRAGLPGAAEASDAWLRGRGHQRAGS